MAIQYGGNIDEVVKQHRLWKGWVLPASGADSWFVAGSARYYRVLESEGVDKTMSRSARCTAA
jgi:hypothetical protein